MRTAHGISKDDWDEVIDLAAKIANAASAEDEALGQLLTTRLLRILDALCAEREPLVVLRSDAVGYWQSEIVTSVARHALSRLRADAVFPLDADEIPARPLAR